jgi:hypothetical protein
VYAGGTSISLILEAIVVMITFTNTKCLGEAAAGRYQQQLMSVSGEHFCSCFVVLIGLRTGLGTQVHCLHLHVLHALLLSTVSLKSWQDAHLYVSIPTALPCLVVLMDVVNVAALVTNETQAVAHLMVADMCAWAAWRGCLATSAGRDALIQLLFVFWELAA